MQQSLENVSNSQPAPEAPLSPASKRKRELHLLMQARKPKKNTVVLYPRQTVSGLLGKDEAARLNASQPTDSSTTTISEAAYSIIGKVLAEVTTTVRSLDGMDSVPRSRLNEMLEKSASEAFPDRTDPVQESSWDQYMRIAREVIGQVMENFKKVIVEVIIKKLFYSFNSKFTAITTLRFLFLFDLFFTLFCSVLLFLRLCCALFFADLFSMSIFIFVCDGKFCRLVMVVSIINLFGMSEYYFLCCTCTKRCWFFYLYVN